jgi:hypothetical protein
MEIGMNKIRQYVMLMKELKDAEDSLYDMEFLSEDEFGVGLMRIENLYEQILEEIKININKVLEPVNLEVWLLPSKGSDDENM